MTINKAASMRLYFSDRYQDNLFLDTNEKNIETRIFSLPYKSIYWRNFQHQSKTLKYEDKIRSCAVMMSGSQEQSIIMNNNILLILVQYFMNSQNNVLRRYRLKFS